VLAVFTKACRQTSSNSRYPMPQAKRTRAKGNRNL
jgi:hypothetical protein